MCDECRLNSKPACPACNEPLQLTKAGWYCVDCGYLQRVVRVVSEETLAHTEIRKLGEK